MTSKKQKRPKTERSVLMRVLSSPKTTLVLGIFAFLSIVYYKVRIAPPDDDPKPISKKTKDPTEDRPLLTLGVLGKTREGGPVLTRSFFATGDIVISGTVQSPQWGLISKSGSAVEVLHPWQSTQAVLPWIQQRGGRFALFRVLASPALQQNVVLHLLPMRRQQSLPITARNALQDRWKLQFQRWLQESGNKSLVPPTSRPGVTDTSHASTGITTPLPANIVAVHWVDVLYRRAGIQNLPLVDWNRAESSKQWLQQLIQKSHYNDLAP